LQKSSLALVLIALCFGTTLLAQPARATGSQTSAAPQILTTVAQVHAVSAGDAAKALPVELHAIVTYYEPTEGQVFVQDSTGGIYIVSPPHPPALNPGDAVVVHGVTIPSFSTNVKATEVLLERHAQFPEPLPVGWRELLQKSTDCGYVSIVGRVRSATLQTSIGQYTRYTQNGEVLRDLRSVGPSPGQRERQPYLLIDVEMPGGILRVHMEDIGGINPIRLLDSLVRISGVAGSQFDGKFQQIGPELWVSTAKHMQVLDSPSADPTAVPLTSIGRIMTGYYVTDSSQRVHVRGSITLYQPGLELVLETPDRQAIKVNSFEQSPLRIGQLVDVVGFPDPHEYSEMLSDASVLPSAQMQPIQPVAVSWNDARAGRHPFELVSMEGKLAAEVHEPHQDTLVIQSGSHVFSAILARTVWNDELRETALPDYRVGSTVRVAGACFVSAGGPWHTERSFDLQLRSSEDVTVLLTPPWWNVRRLLYLTAALMGLMLTALLWALILRRKIRLQTEQIRLTMESEAARERRIAFLEKERGRVLEAINSMLNLDDVLLMILRLTSNQLEERICWCELANGTVVGAPALEDDIDLLVRRGIYSGAGERLGSLVVSGAEGCEEQAGEALEMGASLAALAIDNRRLYDTLVHRSQYDQLTNAANRFLLESRLDEVLSRAKRSRTHFALIYIDLDHFKQVNDLYGHRVGDVYLQQVAERFSEKLRGMDTLARVGGDEFIALIPVVRNRDEVEEIVRRLDRCFDAPFLIDGFTIRGSASIGFALFPDDGVTRDELKRVADTAMYARKPALLSSH
jgi:diguanylate cyclase (GGDEF)-like protein